jgi:hypothetical protein
MATVEPTAPLRLLRVGYDPNDWVAVFLKSYGTGESCQRVAPVSQVGGVRFLSWLRARNAAAWNIYVSVNAVKPHRGSRARDSIAAVRHVFIEADHDAAAVLASLAARRDLPAPSYLLHSSRNRVHVFWRVSGFDVARVEALQKQLAHELKTDTAATSCSQMTRLPGFFNHKYQPPTLVAMVYGRVNRVYAPGHFPEPPLRAGSDCGADPPSERVLSTRLQRARRYLAVLPPAITGCHGDLHTFRVCCRLVRGFMLDDDQALDLLREWNARCQPPWTDRELADKVTRARRYGREPLGGLLADRT